MKKATFSIGLLVLTVFLTGCSLTQEATTDQPKSLSNQTPPGINSPTSATEQEKTTNSEMEKPRDQEMESAKKVEDINKILQNDDFKINDFTQTTAFNLTDTIYERERVFYKFFVNQGQPATIDFDSPATLYIYSAPDFQRKEFVKGGTKKETKIFISQTTADFYLEIQRTGLPMSNNANLAEMSQNKYTLRVTIK